VKIKDNSSVRAMWLGHKYSRKPLVTFFVGRGIDNRHQCAHLVWTLTGLVMSSFSKSRQRSDAFRSLSASRMSPTNRCFSRYSNLLADVNSRSRSLIAVAIPSVVCLSVVCDVGAPYSGGWTFRQFFSPYDSPGTLLFWCQKSLVGDAPFPLKFSFKVTDPPFK